MKSICISLVCYKTNPKDVLNVIQSIQHSKLPWKLIIVDNSPGDEIALLVKGYNNVDYIHNPTNPGFGAAHNIAIRKAIIEELDYHIIINPDIYFNTDVISPMIKYMVQNPSVGMMMPEVLNDDGSIQYLPKLLPSPLWIFRRKFKKPLRAFMTFINKYELRDVPRNRIYNAPILSGCFSLLNLKAINELGGYDDRYFMYFEDFDLSRRIHRKYQTVYFPIVSVYHGYEGGANKNLKLFQVFISSALVYFGKWGWFLDKERKKINKQTLEQF